MFKIYNMNIKKENKKTGKFTKTLVRPAVQE